MGMLASDSTVSISIRDGRWFQSLKVGMCVWLGNEANITGRHSSISSKSAVSADLPAVNHPTASDWRVQNRWRDGFSYSLDRGRCVSTTGQLTREHTHRGCPTVTLLHPRYGGGSVTNTAASHQGAMQTRTHRAALFPEQQRGSRSKPTRDESRAKLGGACWGAAPDANVSRCIMQHLGLLHAGRNV